MNSKHADIAGQNLSAWEEWREVCALEGCAPAARQALLGFAAARFRLYLGRYAGMNEAHWCPRMPEPESCWHFFESHVTVRATRQGKRYKEWLFARTEHSQDPALDVIQGGATLIMRDVVREFLRHELLPHRVSLPQAMLEDCGMQIRRDRLFAACPDPESQAALREYEALARDHAESLFRDAPLPVRVALLACSMGLPLSHDLVQEAAGRRKSALHSGFRDWLRRMACMLQADYRDDPPECRLTLALLVLDQAQSMAGTWAMAPATPARVKALVAHGRRVGSGTVKAPCLEV